MQGIGSFKSPRFSLITKEAYDARKFCVIKACTGGQAWNTYHILSKPSYHRVVFSFHTLILPWPAEFVFAALFRAAVQVKPEMLGFRYRFIDAREELILANALKPTASRRRAETMEIR